MGVGVRFYFILACLVISTGCTTLTKEDCKSANWQKIGYADGLYGELPSKIKEHNYACMEANVTADQEAYEKGRQAGLVQFCTPAKVYRAGATGAPFNNVCPAHMNKELSVQYANGRRRQQLTLEKQMAEKSLEEEKERIAKDRSVVGDIAKGLHLLSGTSPTQAKEDRVQELNKEIYKADQRAPAGSLPGGQLSMTSAEDNNVMTGVLGIGVGAIVGFGSGHAIQGHYRQDGWKWTAIDTAAIGGLMAAGHNCTYETQTSLGIETKNKGGNCSVIMPTAILGFLGLRIWQITELFDGYNWSTSRYRSVKKPTEQSRPRLEYISLVPVQNSTGVGAAFSF